MIQAHLGQPSAPLTALRALDEASTCWEANLICARVLADTGRVTRAEDAILSNLDTNLERHRSLVHLLSLYYRTGDIDKIAKRLADPAVCRDLPVPVLLRCAARLDPEQVPSTVNRQLVGSLKVMPRRIFGADDVVVLADEGWQLAEARVVLALDGKATTIRPRLSSHDGRVVAGFAGATADAFTLFEKFEEKLKDYSGNISRAAVELTKDWRTDRVLRRLEAMLLVADTSRILMLSGTGDVLEPEHGVAAIGSGGNYALSAARALTDHSTLSTKEIATEAMKIAASLCIYTNDQLVFEHLE